LLPGEAHGFPHKALVDQGTLDRFEDVDATLYVDLHLLQSREAPELALG